MAYRLKFFCKASGEEIAAGAMDRVLDALLEDGPPLLGEFVGPPEPRTGSGTAAIHAFRLATGTESGEPAADHLLLEIYVGVRSIAEDVIAADPDDEHGVWGSDLMAVITLSGDRPDWPLVDRLWTVLEDLWSAAPWDELSGFDLAAETQRPLAVRSTIFRVDPVSGVPSPRSMDAGDSGHEPGAVVDGDENKRPRGVARCLGRNASRIGVCP